MGFLIALVWLLVMLLGFVRWWSQFLLYLSSDLVSSGLCCGFRSQLRPGTSTLYLSSWVEQFIKIEVFQNVLRFSSLFLLKRHGFLLWRNTIANHHIPVVKVRKINFIVKVHNSAFSHTRLVRFLVWWGSPLLYWRLWRWVLLQVFDYGACLILLRCEFNLEASLEFALFYEFLMEQVVGRCNLVMFIFIKALHCKVSLESKLIQVT